MRSLMKIMVSDFSLQVLVNNIIPVILKFLILLSLTQRGKVLNEKTSCIPPGRVGKTYELLKVDSECHQVQFSFKFKQLKVL